jgi:phosphoribosylanthranilate isomerase
MAGTRVKVCGLTRRDDVAAAIGQGAWAVGFVLWPGSPRSVTRSQLRELTTDVPKGVKRVAVAVNPDVEDVERWRDEAGLTTLQLHGGEDADSFLSLGMDVFKAVSLESEADMERAAALPAEVTVLVDAHDPVRRGGTGERADWARAAALGLRRPVILAGGLRAENVRDAIAQVNPWGIDVSSGLESAPGIKNIAKLEHFFAMLRSHGAPGLQPRGKT